MGLKKIIQEIRDTKVPLTNGGWADSAKEARRIERQLDAARKTEKK